ncbi:Transcriptional regulator SlyA [Ensifer psoraleae]|nr:Transcriptional regulator SlyA [Sinorhizobium psoraleae]
MSAEHFNFIASFVTCLRFGSRIPIGHGIQSHGICDLPGQSAGQELLARPAGARTEARLRAGQFPVLLELWSEKGLTQKQLLDRLDIEQPTMANTLARMKRDGLITRRRHPNDKRSQQIFLTDRARGIEAAAKEAALAAEQSLLSGFRRFERELMIEYMRMALANTARNDSVS